MARKTTTRRPAITTKEVGTMARRTGGAANPNRARQYMRNSLKTKNVGGFGSRRTAASAALSTGRGGSH